MTPRGHGEKPPRQAGAISPQLAWQRGKQAQGLCTACGKPRSSPYRSRCVPCAAKHRERERIRIGYKGKVTKPIVGSPRWVEIN